MPTTNTVKVTCPPGRYYSWGSSGWVRTGGIEAEVSDRHVSIRALTVKGLQSKGIRLEMTRETAEEFARQLMDELGSKHWKGQDDDQDNGNIQVDAGSHQQPGARAG